MQVVVAVARRIEAKTVVVGMTGGDAFAIAGVQSIEGWGWGWGRAFSDTSSLHPPSPPTSQIMHGASLPASARVVDTQPVQWAN